MFGYVKADTPNMYVKDTILYRAMYCGLCKSIGRICGQRGRFALNYDLTFLSILLHNLTDTDVVVKKSRCAVHWLRKREMAGVDALTCRIAAFNVILAKYKIDDDIIDSGKGKGKKVFFAKAYKRAKRKEPELDKIVASNYQILREYENKNCDSIDMVCDPFGNMLKESVDLLMDKKATDELLNLSYFLGKWIYLIDALDDFDKDKKKKFFNVLVNYYVDCDTKQQLVEKHTKEIAEIFAGVLGEIFLLAKQLNYKFNHDLTDNILNLGIKEQTRKILEKK